jgi:hypothetical protein
MSFSIAASLLVCLVGLVVAVMPGKPSPLPLNRFAPLGVVAFGVGLFYVLQGASHVLHLGP